MEGKNCIVTGANFSIDYATAERLASCGANVYMICRNKERGEAALSEIQSKTGNINVHLEVNNAGLLENNQITTPEGYELNFAVNVFTMTVLMQQLLEKAATDARLITISSGEMYNVRLTNDLQFSDDKSSSRKVKTAQAMYLFQGMEALVFW